MEEELIVTFHTAREAVMGERKLLDAGLRVRVMPMPAALGKTCGIALRIGAAEGEKALLVLGAHYRGVFCRAGEAGEFVPWNP
jgi:hypothetical protein